MSAIRLRPEQVAALTRGQPLPLPPLQETALRTVTETLVRAWNETAAAHGTTLQVGDEAEITSLLEIRLNALRDEDIRWEMLVCGISRGREAISYDGRHLEKSPDLSLHLTRRRFDFPLVVECKLIDRSRRKNVNLYLSEGVRRFVDGEYAWMCAEAFMLAYVRDGSHIDDTLLPHLSGPTATAASGHPQALSGAAELVHSHHERPFAYLDDVGHPGPIVLWHLWLTAR